MRKASAMFLDDIEALHSGRYLSWRKEAAGILHIKKYSV